MKVKNIFVKSKAIVFGMKYIPIIATILATIHIGLLLMGHYEPVTISVATVLLLILMILISIRFHFCKLHKAMVVFMALMVACIGFQTKGRFGPVLTFARLLVFAFGACLSMASIITNKKNDDGD